MAIDGNDTTTDPHYSMGSPAGTAAAPDTGDDDQESEARKELVKEIVDNIKDSKSHFKKAFDRMREDMRVAKDGTSEDAFRNNKKKYIANVIQSFLRARTASLYAKDPKADYVMRPRRNFQIWDGTDDQVAPIVNALAQGQPLSPMQQALMQDYVQGYAQTQMYDGMGDTLVKLFNYYLTEQKPKVKTQMKQLVRRTLTCGVGYIKLGFQRELQRRSVAQEAIDDITLKLEELQSLMAGTQDGSIEQDDPGVEKLRLIIESIKNDPTSMSIVRQGLTFGFPRSTSIIVDKACENLRGFVAAGWIAEECFYTVQEMKKLWPQVNFEKGSFNSYERKGSGDKAVFREQDPAGVNRDMRRSYGCVWTYYEKDSGLQYIVLDGHKDFLEEPCEPNVDVEGFWPIYALVFNDMEDEDEIYPKSDVRHLTPMQDEWNRAREGLREHRQAARPRYATPKGAIEEADKGKLRGASAHEVIEVTMPADADINKVIQRIKTDNLDPQLYTVTHLTEDMQMVAGAQEANMGGNSGGSATATEAQISQQATMSSLESNMDDLDDLLDEIARDGGLILQMNMEKDAVVEIVGPGAVWSESPDQRLQMKKELYVTIEQGSSGRPHRASDLANFERATPYVLQLPGINLRRYAEEIFKVLFNGKYDLKEFFMKSPSAVAMNAMRGPVQGGPGAAPAAQGPAGANNAPGAPPAPQGSIAPMGGNNQ